jgi:hypothetical protein
MESYNTGSESCGKCHQDGVVLDHRMDMCLDCADVGEDSTPEGGAS